MKVSYKKHIFYCLILIIFLISIIGISIYNNQRLLSKYDINISNGDRLILCHVNGIQYYEKVSIDNMLICESTLNPYYKHYSKKSLNITKYSPNSIKIKENYINI